jgi:hypothetical protein
MIAVLAVPMLSALAALAGNETSTRPAPKAEIRTYTNDDLERVHELRGETGVLSEPSTEPSAEDPRRDRIARAEGAARKKDEAYWRREAAKVREKVRNLQERATELRAEIEDARSVPWSSRSDSSKTRRTPSKSKVTRLANLEARIRALEEDLADRARVAGAMPGWIR